RCPCLSIARIRYGCRSAPQRLFDGSIGPGHALHPQVWRAKRARTRRRRKYMPEKQTIERARRDKREGKSPSTQAGEFVREEMENIREGKHGATSSKQAIAIGLSKARRAGVKLGAPKRAKASTRKSARYASAVGQGKRKAHRRPKVSRAVSRVLKHDPHS